MDERSRMVGAGYDRVADCYEALEAREWPRLRRLRELLACVPAGGAVLDLGCGNGVPALREIVLRHRATGVDVSGEQVRRARDNVPGAHVLHGDMVELRFERGSLDAVVSFYAVEHVPRERHAELLRRIHGWLRPGGLLLFSIEAREKHETVGDWLGTPMFFSQFDPDETLRLVQEAGFLVEAVEREIQEEGGTAIEYVWIRVRRDQ